MLQVIAMWNLIKEDEELGDLVRDIDLYGYMRESFLTGEFATKISTGAIRSLSVSNIADKYCPTRRDLYFYKGVQRPDLSIQSTWGSKVGPLTEKFLSSLEDRNTDSIESYCDLITNSDELYSSFIDKSDNNEKVEEIRGLEDSPSAEGGDTNWFLKLLKFNGRAELAIKILHSVLRGGNSLDITHIQRKNINPTPREIGISSPATPDFIIPEFGVVGDIKTGIEFKPHFQLTCAGYALAHENQMGENNEIHWGIIYFFPTRNPSAYVRPITFAQVYIFPIDSSLRQWFLDIRDDAYNIISKESAPEFPIEKERRNCDYCKFNRHCKSRGLEPRENE